MSTPLISVLLCTYDRSVLLQRTLESLCCQSLNSDEFEVIVVDDGSSDNTRTAVEAFESRLNLRYAYQRNSGLASARNHALFLSQGAISLLLDDDDIASPALLEEHLKTHRLFPEDHYAVLGYTALDQDIADDPVMYFATEVGKFLFSYPDIKSGDVLDYSRFWGGRSSCKRQFLLDHGIFNSVFTFGCEDIELAFRLSKFGFKVVYNSQAVTTMIRAYSCEQFCQRLEKQGRSNFVFSQLHPEPIVSQWTEIDDIREWATLAPVYHRLVKSCVDLDRIYRRKRRAGMVTPLDQQLLEEAYWIAFRASKIKGMAEAAAGTSAQPLVLQAQRAENHGSREPEPAANPELSPALIELLEQCPPIHGTLTWGLAPDTLAYLARRVEAGWHTLETGSGLSTLVFLAQGAFHTSVTLDGEEIERIHRYCEERGICTEQFSYSIGPSQFSLPALTDQSELDLVLIDGGHGFPIPFVDWLFCAPRLRLGGILIVDDTQLWTGAVLRDFLKADPDWEVDVLFERGAAFRKKAPFRSKEWNEQPYILARNSAD